MRTRGRIDANQAEIVKRLRKLGVSVQSLADIGDGCPDLLCGLRGTNTLLEVKDGTVKPSLRRLTLLERYWHNTWQGQVAVVHSLEEALEVLGLARAQSE